MDTTTPSTPTSPAVDGVTTSYEPIRLTMCSAGLRNGYRRAPQDERARLSAWLQDLQDAGSDSAARFKALAEIVYTARGYQFQPDDCGVFILDGISTPAEGQEIALRFVPLPHRRTGEVSWATVLVTARAETPNADKLLRINVWASVPWYRLKDAVLADPAPSAEDRLVHVMRWVVDAVNEQLAEQDAYTRSLRLPARTAAA